MIAKGFTVDEPSVTNQENRVFDAKTKISKGSLHSVGAGEDLPPADYSGAAFGNPFADQGGPPERSRTGDYGSEIQPGMIHFSCKPNQPPAAERVEIGVDGRPERRHA